MRKTSDTRRAVARRRAGPTQPKVAAARPASRARTNDGSRAVPGTVPRGSFQLLQGDGFSGLGRIILDKLDRGVILVDARGRVIDANRLARRVIAARDGIRQRARRLVFADASLDRRLTALLAQRRNGGVDCTTAIAARVRRTDGAPYRVVVSTVPEHADQRDVAFIVLIYAPNEQREISTAVLREIYGLTPAQASVASSLFTGRGVEATASVLGLSLNTVRTHLKQIFNRCEVQSQAELLHLLAAGPYEL